MNTIVKQGDSGWVPKGMCVEISAPAHRARHGASVSRGKLWELSRWTLSA
jgi:hypothetical protein